ncbi:MAG: HDOD domain-containing protein [Hydrogenophaga sp.]|nr:HDOD domain-containing protein [Hydrogenophaga sp.]
MSDPTLLDAELQQARRAPALRDIVIPPCPELLVRLQVLAAQPEPDPQELERIASADVAMSAALMRLANSPLHGLPKPVQTMGQALTVIGLQPAVQLLTGFLTRHALQVRSPLLGHFWDTSNRRALACEHIARQLYTMDPGLGHSFGLFCHVGIPVMMQGVKGYSGTLTEALARKDRSFVATENANHRTDHAVVGAIVARTWHLPPLVAHAIRLHHDFASLSDARIDADVRHLVAMALVADHLLHQHEDPSSLREWEQWGAACLAHLQVGESEVEHWIDQLHPVFEAHAL